MLYGNARNGGARVPARAKAVVAWNPQTNEIRSGQIQTGKGFEYWLIKFDGIKGNGDKEQSDPSGYGQIEYAYYRMAERAGIEMSECRGPAVTALMIARGISAKHSCKKRHLALY